MSRANRVPTSRSYVHERCGYETIVNGIDFEMLANPFTFTSSTMCVHCKKQVSLKQVAWSETGESITGYRRRLRREAPAILKLIAWVIGPLLLGCVGAGIGYAIKPGETKGAVVGFFTGSLCYVGVFSPLVTRSLFRVDYRAFE